MKPELLLRHWNINPTECTIKQVNTGLLNKTFIVRTESELFVLQQLHTAVSLPGCTNNYFAVTEFLNDRGFTTQQVIPTLSGSLVVIIDNHTWRLLRGVEGEVFTTTPNNNLAFEAGKLLGAFHQHIQLFEKVLEPTLPMFQYETVLNKLRNNSSRLLTDSNQVIINACQLLLEQLPILLLPKNLPQQIIHTDPKISNFLFNEKQEGICMIDLDTIQTLSPLYDIGDCVRSLCGGAEDDPNNTFNTEHYNAIINGYNASNALSESETQLIPQACELVMLGLAARFLNDYIDDSYFGWDPTRYETRRDHNLARALGQIALYQSFIIR